MSVGEGVAAPGLPAYYTRFIGREAEIDVVRRLLTAAYKDGPRLITLVGVGGSGKTRLAVEVARSVSSETGDDGSPIVDGVHWADLALLNDASRLPQTVASALDLHHAAHIDPVVALRAALRDTRTLLVLDNCEEMVQACQELLDRLLRSCPGLVVLATSREPLRTASGETLSLPPMSCATAETDPAAPSEAAQLFYDRAGLVMPAYPLWTATSIQSTRSARGSTDSRSPSSWLPAGSECCRRGICLPRSTTTLTCCRRRRRT